MQEKDEFFLEAIDGYVQEDIQVDRHINQLNLLALERDKEINNEYLVPAELDLSDEVRFDVDLWNVFRHVGERINKGKGGCCNE